jgi:S-formylglutathione hydrolase FrmB
MRAALRRLTAPRRLALALSLAAWAVGGLTGVAAYAHDYLVYRGFPPPKSQVGAPAGRLVRVRFHSRSLAHERSYSVLLPPGYAGAAARGVRYPVLYLLHGTAGSPRLFVTAGGLAVDLGRLIASEASRPYIVAMPDGRNGTLTGDTEWANTRAGRYESFVLDTVRAVDRRWATIPARGSRAIGGLSAGGYGAVNLALRHLGTFGAVESWSGYFKQSAAGPFKHAPPSALRANSPSFTVAKLRAPIHRVGLRAFLYGGSGDRDTAALQAFARQLRSVGAGVQSATYSGGHDWRLWRAQLPHMLRWAGASFRP